MKKQTVKTILVNLLIAAVLTAVYIALTEQFTLESAAAGFVISIAALFLTRKVFLTTPYSGAFTLGPAYVLFIGYLFFIILKSAAVSLAYIFTKNIGINMIPYKTSLKDDNLKAMLANAISLTPGTVTADINGDTIEVMKLCKLCKLDQTTGFAKIEKILKRMEKEETP